MFLDGLGYHDAAATLSDFAVDSFVLFTIPAVRSTEARLREILGDESYESLTRNGKSMSIAAIAAYAPSQSTKPGQD